MCSNSISHLDASEVQDLNEFPELGLEDSKYDAVIICFAIQYYQFPELILSQIARALKDDGIIILSWGSFTVNAKAIRGWLDRDEEGRIGLVLRLLSASGFISPQQYASENSKSGNSEQQQGDDDLFIVSARLSKTPLKSARDRWGFGRARTQDVEGK